MRHWSKGCTMPSNKRDIIFSDNYITGFAKYRISKGYTRKDIVDLAITIKIDRLIRLEEGWAAPTDLELTILSTLYNVDREVLERFYDLDNAA